jgi:hypothetical protein
MFPPAGGGKKSRDQALSCTSSCSNSVTPKSKDLAQGPIARSRSDGGGRKGKKERKDMEKKME